MRAQRKDDWRIRTNSRLTFPKRWFAFDVECWLKDVGDGVTEHAFRLGTYCYFELDKGANVTREERGRFYSKEDVWRTLKYYAWPNNTLRVVSANIGYDFINAGLPEFLSLEGWTIKDIYIAGLTTIIPATKDKTKIWFLNLQNWFTGSVERIGRELGLEKMEVDTQSEDTELVFQYCQRDTDIVARAIQARIKWLVDGHCGSWANTKSCISRNVYRHKYMTHDIYIHNNQEAIELERKALRC